MKFCGFLIFLLLASSPLSANGFGLATVGIEFFEFIIGKAFEVSWDPIQGLFAKQETEFEKIGKKLDEITIKIDNLTTDFKNAIKDVKNHVTLELKASKIQELQDKIEQKFELTMDYMSHLETLENVTIAERINELTNGPDSVDNLISQFHIKVFGKDTLYLNNIVEAIRENKHHFSTNTGSPEEVVLYKFFLTMLSVEYKAMLMQKINCYLKFRLAMGKFRTEMKIHEDRFVKRVRQSIERMRNAFLSSNRDLYKLDTKNYRSGDTFAEVTRFNQIYFTSESNFKSCWSRCEDYSRPRHNFSEEYSYPQRSCKGTISNCRSEYTNAYHVWTTIGNEDQRYQYVAMKQSYDTFRPGYRYGQMSQVTNSSRIVDFTGWARGFAHCDICRCQCDEPRDEKSLRKFSTTPLHSDTDANLVITGVQIAVENNTFVLKIHQAKLLPLGKVDSNVTVKMNEPSSNDKFFTLRFNKKSVHMGTAKIDTAKYPDFVATMVRFYEKDKNLALQVRFTRFNYTTGQLFDANNAKNNVHVLNNISKNVIVRGKRGNCPIKYTDNVPSVDTRVGLVQFGPSSLHDDVGQRTVPFIDLQGVRSEQTALTGIGLQFRARENSGGYISPTLVTYPMFFGTKVLDAKLLLQ